MSLAKDLLSGVAGADFASGSHVPRRRVTSSDVPQTVLEFFDLCQVFWATGGDRLQQWSQQVRVGVVPDFGANLYY
jgi:hypothetical protein